MGDEQVRILCDLVRLPEVYKTPGIVEVIHGYSGGDLVVVDMDKMRLFCGSLREGFYEAMKLEALICRARVRLSG